MVNATGRAWGWVLLLLLVAGSAPAAAQQPELPAVSDTLYEIRLVDGSTLYGRVTAVDADRVVLQTEGGVRVELSRAQIRSAAPVRGTVHGGEVWPEDPNVTRLFFAPTGRSLRKGEGYAGAFELFFPFLSYGISDRVTLAGGTPILPGLDLIGRVYYLAPKVRVTSGRQWDLSAGVLTFVNLAETDEPALGVLYGVGTWGTTDRAVTAGAGWGFAGSDVQNQPAFLLGGETRVSRRVKLITENYLISYETERWEGEPMRRDGDPMMEVGSTRTVVERLGLVSVGIRLFGERLSADAGVGLGVGGGDDFGCCLPLVNFVYNFGKR